MYNVIKNRLYIQDSCPDSVSWFLTSAEVSDQYMPYVLYSNDMCQKRQMRSDTNLRRPVYDEMGKTMS